MSSSCLQVEYPEIEEGTKPRHRFHALRAPERKVADGRQGLPSTLLFAAEPYEVISFKVPSAEVVKPGGLLSTRTGKALSGPARLYQALSGPARLYQALSGPARLYQALSGPARLYIRPFQALVQALPGCIRPCCQALSGHDMLCQAVSGSVRSRRAVSGPCWFMGLDARAERRLSAVLLG